MAYVEATSVNDPETAFGDPTHNQSCDPPATLDLSPSFPLSNITASIAPTAWMVKNGNTIQYYRIAVITLHGLPRPVRTSQSSVTATFMDDSVACGSNILG